MSTDLTFVQRAHAQGQYVHDHKPFLNLTILPDGLLDSHPSPDPTTLKDDKSHLNNKLEHDHRGIKGRYRSMCGFKSPRSAARFCRAYDELRSSLRPRSRPHQHVPADRRRLLHLQRTVTALAILQAA